MHFKTVSLLTISIAAMSFAQGPSGGAQTQNPPAAGSPQNGPANTNFSIEDDLFAYRALQANSAAIACNLISADVKCDPSASNITSTLKFIVVPSSSATLANYQVWRTNMAIAAELFELAKPLGCGAPRLKPDSLAAVTTGVSSVVTAIQSVLQLFATNVSANGIAGSISDQALVGAVARELARSKATILVPDTYASFGISSANVDQSPFLSRLRLLLMERACLNTNAIDRAVALQTETLSKATAQQKLDTIANDEKIIKNPNSTPAQKDQATKDESAQHVGPADVNTQTQERNKANQSIQQNSGELANLTSLIASIDGFIASVTGGATPAPAAAGAPPTQAAGTAQNGGTQGGSPANQSGGPSGNQPGGPSSQQPPTAPNAAPPNPAASTPPLLAILAADGVARKLGFAPDPKPTDANTAPALSTAQDPDLTAWRVLFLKSFESGGSIVTKSNLFGSKPFFDGGSITTFALFTLDGDLQCSGNAFAYGGHVEADKFDFDSEMKKTLTSSLVASGGCQQPK